MTRVVHMGFALFGISELPVFTILPDAPVRAQDGAAPLRIEVAAPIVRTA